VALQSAEVEPGAPSRSRLFLGRLDEGALRQELAAAGILSALAERGYPDVVIRTGQESGEHQLRISPARDIARKRLQRVPMSLHLNEVGHLNEPQRLTSCDLFSGAGALDIRKIVDRRADVMNVQPSRRDSPRAQTFHHVPGYRDDMRVIDETWKRAHVALVVQHHGGVGAVERDHQRDPQILCHR
jgi:hypothetical protein